MGTDIHICLERRRRTTWERVESMVENKWYPEFDGEPEFVRADWSPSRHYGLFAILAGVRNYFEAPARGHPCISDPRGLPPDCSPETLAEVESWGGHYHSWLLLSEVVAFDWSQQLTATISSTRRAADAYHADGDVRHLRPYPSSRREKVSVEVELPYSEWCWEFYHQDLPRWLEHGAPDELRIVFFFDS